MSDEIRCPYCGGNGKINMMDGVVATDATRLVPNWHQIISPMQPSGVYRTELTAEQTSGERVLVQPCHSFTLETGKPDCDEPTIVEVK